VGGGLIGGIAVAVKSLRPTVRVVGVQAERTAAVVASLAAGQPVTVPAGDTIADGIAVERPGDLPFSLIQHYVDELITVSEGDIEAAMGLLLQGAKLLAAGAGATPLAAILANRVQTAGCRVVLVLSGGNIDLDLLAEVLSRRPQPDSQAAI